MSIYCENCEEAGEACEEVLANAKARIAELEKLAKFGLACIDAFQECYSDLDGGWVQDTAVECGVLEEFNATEPCDPEHCACAEAGDFPTECYRRSKSVPTVL